MIAIYDRSHDSWLTCCMTIGNEKSTTGYFITGVGNPSGITNLKSETVSCTYSKSNKTYTLEGPSDKVSNEFKYRLAKAAVLKIY